MTRRSIAAALVLGVLGVPFVAGPGRAMAAEEAPAKARRVVVHLSHYTNDLHAAAMALKLGTAMQKKGGQVTLFLDLEGVRLADARQPQDLRWGGETPIASYYEGFVKAGGRIVLCPHCAHAAGMKEGDLRGGARMATEDELAQLILEADVVLDY